ncbi:MAG: SprB repeat-containing protein [Chitinophagales bacterium]
MGPGTYTVTVTDGNGCTATASATVTQPAAISAVIASYNDVSCFGANNGNINISVTGGVTPYTFGATVKHLLKNLVNVGRALTR